MDYVILNFISSMNNRKIICDISGVDRRHLIKRLKEDHVKNADTIMIATENYIFIQDETIFCEGWNAALEDIVKVVTRQENKICILTYRLYYSKAKDLYCFITET